MAKKTSSLFHNVMKCLAFVIPPGKEIRMKICYNHLERKENVSNNNDATWLPTDTFTFTLTNFHQRQQFFQNPSESVF
jgi:hypothetical protein